jgi:putative FmdB family regulatory protein
MPIYAYRCNDCGFAKDVLQKMSDEPLSDCPSCGKASFKKQVTAAGFQLKGSGWYVTDFRGDAGSKTKHQSDTNADVGSDSAKSATGEGKASEAPTAVSVSTDTVSTPTSPATPTSPSAHVGTSVSNKAA